MNSSKTAGLALALATFLISGLGVATSAAAQADTVALALEAPGGPTSLSIANAKTGRDLFAQQMPNSQNGQTNLTDMVASPATKLVYATLEDVDYPYVVAIDPRTGTISKFFTVPGGDGAWQLALSADGLTLFVAGAEHAYRVNAATGALEYSGPAIGGFPQTGYHMLAASPTQPLLFTPFGSGYTVNDAKGFKYLYQVDVGVTPLAFAVSPDGKLLYTAQYDLNAYIIDIAKRRVLSTIALGTLPNDMVSDPATARLYVATTSGVSVISTKSASIVATVGGIGSAVNLAIDPVTHACFAATDSGLWRIEPRTLATHQLYAAGSVAVAGVSETY